MHCRLRLDPSTWRSKPGTRFCCLSSLFWNGFKVMTWYKLDTVSFRLSIPGYLEASLPATEKAVQVKNIVICGLTFLATCLTTSTPSLPLISNSLDILPWSTWERLAAIARWANSCRKGISKDMTRFDQMSFWNLFFPSITGLQWGCLQLSWRLQAFRCDCPRRKGLPGSDPERQSQVRKKVTKVYKKLYGRIFRAHGRR